MTPEEAMRQALLQARRSEGKTFPNPPVGAVVFRGERILGRGGTRAAGEAHAEIVALHKAVRQHGQQAVRGASMAVSLEPCVHQGRTGPCVDAILQAGIRRVFVGQKDPNPEVHGRGMRKLRRAGVEVESGILETECAYQHRGFTSVHVHGRPHVALKLAATLDGRIATAGGESHWITGPAARAHVHTLRERADAVMVGAETALMDDPALTARRDGRVVHRPVRLLVDSQLRVPPSAKLFRGRGAWVLCASKASGPRVRARERRGIKLVPLPSRGRHLNLARAMQQLAKEGLTSILLEGGGRLAAAMLRAGLIDEVHWYSAAKLLGSDARPALAELGVKQLADGFQLGQTKMRRIGSDLYMHGMIKRGRQSK